MKRSVTSSSARTLSALATIRASENQIWKGPHRPSVPTSLAYTKGNGVSRSWWLRQSKSTVAKWGLVSKHPHTPPSLCLPIRSVLRPLSAHAILQIPKRKSVILIKGTWIVTKTVICSSQNLGPWILAWEKKKFYMKMISQFLGSRKASQAPSLMVPRVGCSCTKAPDTSIVSCAKMPAFFSFCWAANTRKHILWPNI